jgi:hypothetical protein
MESTCTENDNKQTNAIPQTQITSFFSFSLSTQLFQTDNRCVIAIARALTLSAPKIEKAFAGREISFISKTRDIITDLII